MCLIILGKMSVHCHSFGEGEGTFGIIFIEIEEMWFDFMRVENSNSIDFIHELGNHLGDFF